jgi:hypothetical protein
MESDMKKVIGDTYYKLVREDGALMTTKVFSNGEDSAVISAEADKAYSNYLDNYYKVNKLKEVRKKYQNLIDKQKSNYADYEIDSFVDQRREWTAWSADDTTPTPIVDALAAGRGIDRLDLLAKIGNNVVAIAMMQGQQNALEDKIKACTTLEELEAIEV